MKQIILTLFASIALLINTNAQVNQNVDAAKFKELISKGDVILVDVRTPQEYYRGHIAGSTAIDISDPNFVTKINLLQKEKTILIYCLTGSRSYAAANYMSKNGFKNIYNLQRGIMEWNQKGYPIEQSSQTVASAGATYSGQSFDKLLKDNKVVLVDFHAVWCGPCKAMNPVIDKVSTDFKGKARVEKVDVEANKELTTAYQVQSVPQLLIFKDGKKVWSHNGTISYDDLTVALKKFL
jgi:thioredoxin